MPGKQGIYRIDKQEAKRDIINVAGNYFIQHPIKHEPVYIPTIQSVLKKEKISEGEFFRKEPEWVDYEQGYIVERKEVDEIINRLENDKIQLVLGNPASGKSICLKNVGYKLVNEDKKVYVMELKKHPRDEVKLFFDYIPNIDDDIPIFIVDDVHLYLSECERLIRNFKGRGKGKLIIGSRVTKDINEGFDPTESLELEYLSKTATLIQADDVTEGMIETFLKAQYNLNEDRIKTVSDNLGKYKKDLWYLSWALKAYDFDNESIDEDKIYENNKKRIEKVNGEDVFVPLSIFYRYEIPIERKFLEKQLGIENRIIEDLLGLNEIVETEEIRKPVMLSLHHSSIAELYLKTYQNYPDLGIDTKDKILKGSDGEELEFCSFFQYITTTDTRNFLDVAISLGKYRNDDKSGKTLLKNLIENEKIQKSVLNGLDKEKDIEKVGWCVRNIASESKEVATKLVNNININALSSKIEKEEDIEKVGYCISVIVRESEEVAMKLINSMNFAILSLKIEKEGDIDKIGKFLTFFTYACEDSLKLLNLNTLILKIEKEEYIEKILHCMMAIAYINHNIAYEIENRLSLNLKEELNNHGYNLYAFVKYGDF